MPYLAQEIERPSARQWTFVAILMAIAFALRFGYLSWVHSIPAFTWEDPDSYLEGARMLAGPAGWRWSFEAVTHSVEGRDFVLPPLYPAFLSIFALARGFPFSAQLTQVILATISVGLVFELGRSVHNVRAGIIAAAVMAVWLPNIIAVWSTMQEALYVPIVLFGLVVLFRAVREPGGLARYFAAGAVFGLAALTRSMPMFFVGSVAVLLPSVAYFVGRAVPRAPVRRAAKCSLALTVGFALLTVPYSLMLSRHLHQATFIENHGGLRVVSVYSRYQDPSRAGTEPPGLVGTASMLARAVASEPRAVFLRWEDTLKSVLHINGGRLLQIYLHAGSRWGASFWKWSAHLFADLPFLLSLLLAPIGLVVCRRAQLGLWLGLWLVVVLGLTVLSGFGGARLRAPIEPILIVLSAAVLAGGYRRVRLVPVVASLAVSGLLAGLVLPQIPRSVAARGDYGVDWPLQRPPKRSPFVGQAGLNALALDGTAEVILRPRHAPGRATRVGVVVNGEARAPIRLESSEHRLSIEWSETELVFLEFVAVDAETQEPAKVFVIVPRRS